jgi:hypothetical protein
VGSPALGPVPFMHRASASANPTAPLSHHFLDATHISHGVLTAGLFNELLQLEASWFNGHEPDQRRWSPDAARLNSYSARLTVTPGRKWAIQASFGDLDEPEQLHPAIDVRRTTVSATYVTPFARGSWATTAAWGRNSRNETTMTVAEARARLAPPILAHYLGAASIPPDAEDRYLLVFEARTQSAYLVESSLSVGATTAFGRYEHMVKDELFPATDLRHSRLFPLSKLSLGVVRDLALGDAVRVGLGGTLGLHFLSGDLEGAYGDGPRSWSLFARATF